LQIELSALGMTPRRDVAPARTPGTPCRAAPTASASELCQRAFLRHRAPSPGRTCPKTPRNPRATRRTDRSRTALMPVGPSAVLPMRAHLPRLPPYHGENPLSPRHGESPIKAGASPHVRRAHPVQPPVRSGPPWPPPLDTCMCPPLQSTDPLYTPPRIHRGSSCRVYSSGSDSKSTSYAESE
jgi:hypothetical protein